MFKKRLGSYLVERKTSIIVFFNVRLKKIEVIRQYHVNKDLKANIMFYHNT